MITIADRLVSVMPDVV